MALDHSTLGLEKNSWTTNQGEFSLKLIGELLNRGANRGNRKWKRNLNLTLALLPTP